MDSSKPHNNKVAVATLNVSAEEFILNGAEIAIGSLSPDAQLKILRGIISKLRSSAMESLGLAPLVLQRIYPGDRLSKEKMIIGPDISLNDKIVVLNDDRAVEYGIDAVTCVRRVILLREDGQLLAAESYYPIRDGFTYINPEDLKMFEVKIISDGLLTDLVIKKGKMGALIHLLAYLCSRRIRILADKVDDLRATLRNLESICDRANIPIPPF